MLKDKNMRIGILTFQRTTNFGSALQAYATYRAIQKLGYTCDFIDYICPAIEEREIIKKVCVKSIKDIAFNVLFYPIYKKKAQFISAFLNEKTSFSNRYSPANINEVEDLYDLFLVGSDIVWGRDITNNDYNYFFEFVKNKRKIAFSSSVGDYSLRGDEKKIHDLLSRFNKISVREKEMIGWLDGIGIKGAIWTCDPTMLLTREEWDETIEPKKKRDDYVLIYFLDDNKKALSDAKIYAKKNGLKIYFINYAYPRAGIHNVAPCSLDEFLNLIRNAKMIFTASYHGMLFSIYYEKQFVFYTRAHKSRMLSLSERLGLQDRCGDNIDVLNLKRIDYRSVIPKVDDFRIESEKCLKDMLDDEQYE